MVRYCMSLALLVSMTLVIGFAHAGEPGERRVHRSQGDDSFVALPQTAPADGTQGGEAELAQSGSYRQYQELGNPVFSSDSERVAFRARLGKGWCIVVDGVAGPAFEDVGDPFFSPDGKRIMHKAKVAGSWQMQDRSLDDAINAIDHNLDLGPIKAMEYGARQPMECDPRVSSLICRSDSELAFVLKRLTEVRALDQTKIVRLFGEDLTDKGLALLKGLPSLEAIDLRGANITDRGLAFLTAQYRLVAGEQSWRVRHRTAYSTLAHLSLAGPGVSEAGLEALRGEGIMSLNLTGDIRRPEYEIDTSGPLQPNTLAIQVTAIGLKAIASLPHLRELYIRGTELKDDDLRPLAAVGQPYGGFSTLSIHGCELTDKTLEMMHEWPLKRLEIISRKDFTDKGIGALSPALEVLWIGGFRRVTDAGWAQLKNHDRLREVELYDANGLQMLKDDHPKGLKEALPRLYRAAPAKG